MNGISARGHIGHEDQGASSVDRTRYRSAGSVMWTIEYNGPVLPQFSLLIGVGIGGLDLELSCAVREHEGPEPEIRTQTPLRRLTVG